MFWRLLPTLLLVACLAHATAAQSLSDRIADYRRRQQAQAPAADAGDTPDFVPIPVRLQQTVLDPVNLREVPMRQTLTWFARATGVPVVVQWDKLESEGIDAETPISLQMSMLPAEQFLSLVAQQASNDTTPLMWDVTPWYAELLTRRQANSRVVVRVYEVGDLVMTIPQFTQAPRLDLNSALGTSSGNGGTGGGNQVFGDTQQRDDQTEVTQRGEALAQLIRDTIEPDIWIENGGENSSVQYRQGRLIVRAPRYVHRLIAGQTSDRATPGRQASGASLGKPAATSVVPPAMPGVSNGVSGVQRQESPPVAGVGH